MITFRQFGGDEGSPFGGGFDNDGGVTHTCHNAVSFHEILPVGIGSACKFGQQTSLFQHADGCLPMFGRINTVQSVCQHAYGLEMILQGGAMRMDINAISQPAHYQGVRTQCRQVGKETGADILPVGGGMTGSYYINNMQRVQIGISPIK